MPEKLLTRKWRRLDDWGMEVLNIRQEANGMVARSMLVHAGAEPFGLQYVWQLDCDWRTRRLELQLTSESEATLQIERSDGGWRVNGELRPDLANLIQLIA